MKNEMVVLEGEPEHDYAERVVATLERGCLVISHQFFSPDNQRWQSWQDSGSVITSVGVARLRDLLVNSPSCENVDVGVTPTESG